MMQNSAKQVEGMVRQKMEQKEYILLCLEDTNDWSNATTRRLVMQVRRLTEWFKGFGEMEEQCTMRYVVMLVHVECAAAGTGQAKGLPICRSG